MRQTIGVDYARLTWAITTGVFTIVAVVLFFSGYDGYGGVFLAVAAAAAVNLAPAHPTAE